MLLLVDVLWLRFFELSRCLLCEFACVCVACVCVEQREGLPAKSAKFACPTRTVPSSDFNATVIFINIWDRLEDSFIFVAALVRLCPALAMSFRTSPKLSTSVVVSPWTMVFPLLLSRMVSLLCFPGFNRSLNFSFLCVFKEGER